MSVLCCQGLASLLTNPILQDVVSGLACTATAFAAIEVRLLPVSLHTHLLLLA